MSELVYVGADPGYEVEDVSIIDVLKVKYSDLSKLEVINRNLVLTSKRGVIALKMGNVRIKSKRIYCIGQVTAQHLEKLYGRKCIVPKEENSDGLAESLIPEDKEVVIVSSDHVSGKMIAKINGKGIRTEIITAYKLVENKEADYSSLIDAKGILVGSAKSFEILARNKKDMLYGKDIYAIGAPTEKEISRQGFVSKETFATPNIKIILGKIKSEKDLSED